MNEDLLRQARTLQRLADALVAAQIPIETVRHVGGVYEIVYLPDAPEDQRLAGDAILAGFDATPETQQAADVAERRQSAAARLVTGGSDLEAAVRGAVAALWTHGRNDVAEGVNARFALLYAALGVTPPTDEEVAAKILELRAGYDPNVTPEAVAEQSRRRLMQPEILQASGTLIATGGGDPFTP
jgi:hypothetical protein